MSYSSLTDSEMWERAKLARDLDHRLQLYWVSLLFTLASLAVQSAKAGGPAWRLQYEIGGWILLLLAGLIGLARLKYSTDAFRTTALISWKKTESESKLDFDHLVKAKRDSRQQQLGWLISRDRLVKPIFSLQYAFSFLGVLALVISRAILLVSPT